VEAGEVRQDDGDEDRQDGQHDEQLHQGKAGFVAARVPEPSITLH
jgi:hypothetical protein